MLAVLPHLQARCALWVWGFEGREGWRRFRLGGGEFLSELLMSCDNEQHLLTLSHTIPGAPCRCVP